MTTELMIEMNNVHKWFGDLHVLNDVNLKVNKSEKIVICGPSGSGKSTLIRCINRLEEHQDWQATGHALKTARLQCLARSGYSLHQQLEQTEHGPCQENQRAPNVPRLMTSSSESSLRMGEHLVEHVLFA